MELDKILIGKIIKTERKKLGLTQEELAFKLGLNNKSSISQYEKGDAIPSDDIKFKMCELFDCTIDYLLGKTDVRKNESNVFPLSDEAIPVPVVGKISAGLPILATENIERYEFAPSSMIKKGFTYFYLTVQGDSMNRKFNNGDIVLVQQQSDLENDEIGVFLIGEEATVKRYKEEKEKNRIILYPMSTNPEHDPQIYDLKEKSIKIIGKVISYQGKV